jgi:hypothetical protein
VVIVAFLATTVIGVDGGMAGRPAPPPPPPAGLEFSGRTWYVKSTSGSKVGPGPNHFSAANAFVDASGRLHLRINRDNKRRWQSAEVFSTNTRSLGYGTYRWTIASDVDRLDPNVVLGLFTWSDDPTEHHREIDVEIARWGSRTDPTNGQYVVQPWDLPGHLHRFAQGAGVSTHAFTWSPGKVEFWKDGAPAWTYAGDDVPTPGDERVHLNLWLMNGLAPTDGRSVEVVIQSFAFTPLG